MAIILGILGLVVDFPVITVIAALKSPYMLFKGWHRLFQDCVGREGPFLETLCVPFAGLAILLWPLAVAGAVLGSMVSGILLGLYAAVIVYQVTVTKFLIKYWLQKSILHLFHLSCRGSRMGGTDGLHNSSQQVWVKFGSLCTCQNGSGRIDLKHFLTRFYLNFWYCPFETLEIK